METKILIEKAIKAWLPRRLLLKIQRFRLRRYRTLTSAETFSEIYRKNTWGQSKNPDQPFFSGGGSHHEKIASAYVKNVGAILQSFPTKPNVVDLGCGDFSIGSQIRPFCAEYIACDIVPSLINFNRTKYHSLSVDFRLLNLSSDELPEGDIVFIRQVLQHLSNQEICTLIPKLKPAYKYLVLTEHLPASNDFVPNLDKQTGPDTRLIINSGVVLTKPPFNLNAMEERLLCEVNEYGGFIRTTMYRLR